MIRYPDTLPEAVDPEAARIRMMNAHAAIKAQDKSEAFAAAVNWLDALIVMQQSQVSQIKPEKLVNVQARLKQLVELRKALTAPGIGSTGFIFE